ncbi:unnamed protein product [Cunninghamella blakesleeana]
MGLIGFLLLVLLLFGISVFILLFGESPSLRHGIVGKAHKFLTTTLPKFITLILRKTLGQSNLKRLSACWIYSCESRNPFLQILFVAISMVSIAGFLVFALPHVPGIYLNPFHLVLIPIQIIWLYLSYFIACAADPGKVNEKNVNAYIDQFPYDGLLYIEKDCWTCNIQKPARSKHCPLCKTCIARLDHHCAWLNKCVGYNNHRYFFLFLFTLTQFCAYGFYLCFQIYRGMVVEWGLDKAFLYDKVTGEKRPLDFRNAMIHILHRDRIIGSIGILAIVVSVVVFIFTAYQLYLAGRGITTNEAYKWEVLEDAIYRGEIWIEESDNENENKSAHKSSNLPQEKTKSKGKHQHQHHNNKVENNGQFIRKRNTVNNNNDKNSPSNAVSKKKERQIRSLEEIDNIYDKGFFANLYDIFFPKPIIS